MSRQKKYWLCQILGWGVLYIISYAFVYYFLKDSFLNTETKKVYLTISLFCAYASSIITTHLLRLGLKKLKWQSFNATNIIFTLIVGVIVATFFDYYFEILLEKIPTTNFAQVVKEENKEKAIVLEKELGVFNTDYYLYENNKKLDSVKYSAASKIKKNTNWYRNKNNEWQAVNKENERLFGGLFNNFFLIALWVLVYAVYHYIKQNRNNQIDKLKLEAVVKSLELKTIKSHINPHFIFNALNSIRALVDENPERARTAITELSNILRSSLQAEKQETVSLEQELDIVNDYLALEQMRFEERLQVELYIDEETLVEPVPPMMLQTLVENAIKHGISKQETGGKIIIYSKYINNTHELRVVNSGNLMAAKKGDETGFGIKSTQDRLNLLFQEHARFEIKQLPDNMVESKIIMPKTF
jgi:Histidine kinase